MIRCQTGAWMAAMILAALLPGGCRESRDPSATNGGNAPGAAAFTAHAPIAVTSSYLEAAVRDLRPEEGPLVRLAGPSMCPGHFDMRPSQLDELARCRLLLRFDFQQSLDEKLRDRTEGSLTVLPVAVPGGLCVPETYLEACRQIAKHLVSAGEMDRPAAERRLAEISGRMRALGGAVRRKINAAELNGAPVLCSGHQAAFCRRLGLRPVAEFSGGDTAGTGEIDRAVKAGQAAGVKLIIANEPEGRRLADALADRLHARVAVFANFPKTDRDSAFDEMVRGNLAALLETGPSGKNAP